MINPDALRQHIAAAHLAPEEQILSALVADADISTQQRQHIAREAANLVAETREDSLAGVMDAFIAEYGLSTNEGIVLMCLAEALLRVPDTLTMDALIEDKLATSSWQRHQGKSFSTWVNASTLGLMLTGNLLDEGQAQGAVRGLVKRIGKPFIRTAVRQAMKIMGNHFVLGETIDKAVKRGQLAQDQGYTYSYDMLGEAAITAADALAFYNAYKAAIDCLTDHLDKQQISSNDFRDNPGISIKLSALHPRYEVSQTRCVMAELVERVLSLCLLAKGANMGLVIDAEEAERLDLSLDVIETVLCDERLAGWHGFGVVVQAYGKRASYVIDWLYALASHVDRKITLRLVKGAYWDREIKYAQEQGLQDFPVYTCKANTDVAYICCAKKLLVMTDRIYPQFATHNAHSITAILQLSSTQPFEFQRLHGMGQALHGRVVNDFGGRCRIYAPVGAHRELLAYLVRRLLENGANSSFVNQIADLRVTPEVIAADPFDTLTKNLEGHITSIRKPSEIYFPERLNSKGWDVNRRTDVDAIESARLPYRNHQWIATPIMVSNFIGGASITNINPANPADTVGKVIYATAEDVTMALAAAQPWQQANPKQRQDVLFHAAQLYQKKFGELFAVLTREAGKTPLDAIAELREAVDFLRYYAAQAQHLDTQSQQQRGLIACISPWNFPLAIFTGQIAAALAAGNGVLAKPADATPIVASLAVKLLHQAGVPLESLQLLPGRGSVVGAKLVSNPHINGVCFTGSTQTAQTIHKAMAQGMHPAAPLIAETGGINAMIVDSTALPEQSVKDIIASAFQSSGQRCSALRLLYLQEEIAENFLTLLFGAMDQLRLDDPWQFATDIGPIINQHCQSEITQYIDEAKAQGRLLKQLAVPDTGFFVGPAVVSVAGIVDLAKEIFGPVLHIATFKAQNVGEIVSDINASGYGLTFGLHTRMDQRVEQITRQLKVGNIYVNRNQIGAVVGSQPFGGEGLSGTGPKAGGPSYLPRFVKPKDVVTMTEAANKSDITKASNLTKTEVQHALHKLASKVPKNPLHQCVLPGPTGEANRLHTYARGVILCLGPTVQAAKQQADIAVQQGCPALIVCHHGDEFDCLNLGQPSMTILGKVAPQDLASLTGFAAVVFWGHVDQARTMRTALASRPGEIIPLIYEQDFALHCIIERHVCIDTTASGGNTALLSGNSE